jgi:hypothetical protein
MQKPPKKKILGWDPDRHSAIRQMQFVVDGLNGPKIKTRPAGAERARWKRHQLPDHSLEMEKELRRLVEEWKRSGPNVIKLFELEPELAAFSTKGQFKFYPTNTGRGYLEWIPSDAVQGVSPPKDAARDHFMMLISNPEWKRLGGPCLACGDYFRRKTDRPRVYCSIRCGSKTSAVKATKTTRQRDHVQKLQEAQALIEKCNRTPRKDWKAWVVRQGSKRLDVIFTRRWLTRAVNCGDLMPPNSF